MNSFVPLHLHDFYSLLDGADAPEAYMKRANELGITAMAETNHGTLSGHREFYFAAQKHGIKPILGLEAYISSTDRFDKRAKKNRQDGTSVYNHITLLAKNDKGLNDLNRLSELAWSEGYYFKPRIDTELLYQYSDNLIVLSGCLNGLIANALETGEDDISAKLWAQDFKEAFGDRFFMEVQSHNPPEINHKLLELADSMGIEPVMASDCHYARPEDLWIEEALLILATNPKVAPDVDMSKAPKMDILDRFNYLYPDRQMTFRDLQLYLREYATERQMFQAQGIDRTDIFENTRVIADMVEDNYSMPKGLDLLPAPKVDANERLQTLVQRGLKRRGVDGKQEYIDRAAEELAIIKSKNFAAYFLIDADLIAWGKTKDILFGPGRGSAAGSLVLYALNITEVDPIKYNLLFARFMNPDRNDWPDVDQDIEDKRRGEAKAYLTRKFKNVASISTYSYFKDKGVVRDASRALAVPLGDVNKVLKTVESFEDFEGSSETKWFRDKYPDVTKLARALRGRIRSVGMHAAGLVIAKEPINKYAPIETRKDTQDESAPRIPVVAYDMDTAADIGLIKFDMLGLTTLSVINDALKMIKQNRGDEIVLTDIDLDDPAVLKDLSNGFTKAVFQAEAAPSTALLKRMGVEKFDHVVAANALVRPGAMDSIGPDYIARKQGRMSVPKIHPIYDEITKETFGAVLYQEQVMLLCNQLAGMSWSDADHIRKIIGKKKDVHEFDQYRDQFIEGASKHVNKAFAEKLWHDFEAHANYSFNKCAYYGTKIQMADGSVKTMSQISSMIDSGEDVYVMSMWHDGEMRPHRVKSVAKTGRKKLFRVKTESNRVMHITEDHRLLTTDGYKPLSAMTIGDELIVGDKWASSAQRKARSKNMKALRSSSIGKSMDRRAASRMKSYQSTLTFEQRSAHQKKISATTDRSSKVLPALWKGWRDAWSNEEWRVNFMEKTLAAPRGYSTGSGYGNSGFAKDGITWCASVPERELADWLIDNDVPFDAHKVLPSGRMCDFYIDGLYVEMDGMDRSLSYFEEKYSKHGLPFIVVTPEDYREILSAILKVMHVRNGDKIISIEESGYNKSANNYTMDIEMYSDGPKNFITIDGIVSHNSHSVAYSMLIMWTAWLKHYYPLEFMCAALINCDSKETKTDYLIEARRLGIKIMMPHVNKSDLDFSIDGDGLRFGLTDIKFISAKVGKNIKSLGQQQSYDGFVDAAAQRGTGVNTRAVKALDLIGALRFPDNPLRGDEKDYMYEYLGVPNFNIDAVPDYVTKDFLMDFEENGVFVFVAMVKSIKRGKGWSRVELVDDTGSAGIFHSEHSQMQPGSLYLVLVSDNRILRYINIEEISSMHNDPFLHWLKSDTINIPHDKKVVIAFSSRETKAGKKMATVLFSKQSKELQSVLVFPKMFPKALGKLKPGNVVSVTLGSLDDGTRFVKAIGD